MYSLTTLSEEEITNEVRKHLRWMKIKTQCTKPYGMQQHALWKMQNSKHLH